MAFLTIFNTETASKKNFEWNEMSFEFNFKKQTFIFATTESDKIFPPLKDRLTNVDFEPYSEKELGQILKLCASNASIPDDCLEEVSHSVRNNARNAVMRAKEISLYCGAKDNYFFSLKDFKNLCKSVSILPLGLTYTEKQILETLHQHGSTTLTGLSAKLGLSKTCIQKDHELYLLNKNLIEIDGRRKITSKGIDVCKQLQKL